MTCRVDLTTDVVPQGYTRGRSVVTVVLWWIVQGTLFRWSPRPAYGWRRLLLRLFGAKMGRGALVRPSVRVEHPWRLSIGAHSSVGDDVWLYSIDQISIGDHCVVSQKSFLCTASHNPDDRRMALTTGPISIGDGAWIAADVFVGPGVHIAPEAVVGARSSVFGSLPPGMVCFGNPCVPRRKRRLESPGCAREEPHAGLSAAERDAQPPGPA